MIPCSILILQFQLFVLGKPHLWDLSFCQLEKKGKRYSLPIQELWFTSPSAGFQGQATDIQIHAKEIQSLKNRLNTIYSKHTGKSVDEISKALERDNFMTPDEAKKFGLIDSVRKKGNNTIYSF